MAVHTIESVEITPYFDLELFLTTSQEQRIGGETMERVAKAWDRWVPHAHARKLTVNGKAYLLVWLSEAVESEVDDLWESSPTEAFLFNSLAQVMCMGMVHSALPQVEEAGCAPAPAVTDALSEALDEVGVSYIVPGTPGLARKYAVVTYYPFRGGCEVCSLRDNCPKASGCATEPANVVLPGFE